MQKQTFTKDDRLLQRHAFLNTRKNGKKFANRYFIAQVCVNDHNRCRLGLTISKRVGKATVRNRLKRHAREFFRKNRQFIRGHLDINLIAKNEAGKSLKCGKVAKCASVAEALENIFAEIANYPKK